MTQARPIGLGSARREARNWAHFAADVAATRPLIAGPSRVCNLLEDRYRFLVGLSAAMLNGQATVLPSARAPGAIRLALGTPKDACLLGPSDVPGLAARHVHTVPDGSGTADPDALRAAVTGAAGRVEVFTSGSTGAPVCHGKTWASLAGGAALSDTLYRRAGLSGRFAILGTTPHQHMFGLEAAVFAALAHGHELYRGPVFYPDDLASAAGAAAEQGVDQLVLVTSPAHLRYLEPGLVETPMVRMVLSATAPMPLPLAERLEESGLPVYEIYGSTETGSLGWRRSIEGAEWRVQPGFTLDPLPEHCLARAPHLPGPIPLGDLVEVLDEKRFLLLGRLGDMIHVAGKRASLGALNAVLVEAPGLSDGVVLRTRTGGDDQLSILAVRDRATTLSEAEIRAGIRRHMQAHVDPVFIPRRISFVARLPRSATGKLAAGEIARLADRLS
ncbi:MAG: AMP-binding protein [Pseudomonadota bacterium]